MVRVLDIGSRVTGAQSLSHRSLFDDYRVEYVGTDLEPGQNVDVVMKSPYRLPVKSASFDVVLAGQVFEHVPYPWVLFLEMARVTKPGGYLMITAPSRGHRHAYPYDCWRYYPDAWHALATFARMEVLEAHTDFPPTKPQSIILDYTKVPKGQYWGDSVGVFRRPREHRGAALALLREALVWWGNRHSTIKPPRPKKG